MKATCMKKREFYKVWPPIPLYSDEIKQENAPKKIKSEPFQIEIEPFPVHKQGDTQKIPFVLNAQNAHTQQQQQQQHKNAQTIAPKIKEENKVRKERRAHLLKSLVTRLKNARPHAMHWYTFVKRPTDARSRYPLTETLKGYSKVMARSYPEFNAVYELYHDEDWSRISEDVFVIPYIAPYEADFVQLKPPVLIPKLRAHTFEEDQQRFSFLLPQPFIQQPLFQLCNQVSEPFVPRLQSIQLPTEQHRVCIPFANPIFAPMKDNIVSLNHDIEVKQ